MWFAVELLDRGLITTDQFFTALRDQMKSRRPIGELAIEENRINLPTLVELLTRQAQEDRPIGELAVESGAMNREDLAALMLRQVEESPSLEDMLVAHGAISAESLSELRNQFRGDLRQRVGLWYQEPSLCEASI